MRAHVLLCFQVWLCLVSATARAEERFALLIGANAGWAHDQPLRYAEADAERMRQVLVELGGFPADRVYLLKDPGTEEVRARLRSLAQTLQGLERNSLVVFYYAGHADAESPHLRGLPLSFVEVDEALKQLPATSRVALLDVSRAGALSSGQGAASLALDAAVVDAWSARGFVRLTVSGADELSRNTRGSRGSVFTHHWVSGLRGAGDVNGDGAVTLEEAWGHALQRTWAEATPRPLPPPGKGLSGPGHLVLTRWVEGAARLVLPAGQEERYVVVDAPELQWVAEAYTRRDEPVTLNLTPGAYRVKRVRAAQLEVAEVTLEPSGVVDAASLTYVRDPRFQLLRRKPEEGDARAQLTWKRDEALRLLSAGDAASALSRFEAILELVPEDTGARRGKARALVRLAERHRRQKDPKQEARALRAALEADPSMSMDPDFASSYRHLRELEAEEELTRLTQEVMEQRITDNPRRGFRWGAGVDFMGRGVLGLTGSVLLGEHVFVYGALDLLSGPAADMGVRLVPGHDTFTLYLSMGGRVLLTPAPLLMDIGGGVFGSALHFGLGVQYFQDSGLSMELGLESFIKLSVLRGQGTGGDELGFWPMINLSVQVFKP